MLIITADDFGRNRLATERILFCHKLNRVTSTSAMVFMEDSIRASELSRNCNLDIGLHINFTEQFTSAINIFSLNIYHRRIIKFLRKNKFSLLFYNHALRKEFAYVFQTQLDEFVRLYRKLPTHLDGHHHMHLCANMLLAQTIPSGTRIRKNFSFASGEKIFLNRMYRSLVDTWLTKRHIVTDYVFSLADLIRFNSFLRISKLARSSTVEIITHPEIETEYEWLIGDQYIKTFEI